LANVTFLYVQPPTTHQHHEEVSSEFELVVADAGERALATHPLALRTTGLPVTDSPLLRVLLSSLRPLAVEWLPLPLPFHSADAVGVGRAEAAAGAAVVSTTAGALAAGVVTGAGASCAFGTTSLFLGGHGSWVLAKASCRYLALIHISRSSLS
jgi:hypothetical protein